MISNYDEYAYNVLNGNVIAGNSIKLAAQRYLELKSRDDLYFDENKVQNVIRFISNIRHYIGRHANENFVLEPWEKFIIAHVFGIHSVKTKKRLTRNVFIEIARKSGKSSFASAIALYLLIADGEQSPEVVFAANSREQARILLEITSNFAKSIDPKGKIIKILRNDIKVDANKGHAKIVAADTSKLDGLNLSSFIIDEYHEAKDTKMIDVLTSSQGMREEPLGMIITTAGFNQLSPCKKLYDTSKEILQGVKNDDSYAIFIFEMDEDDSWDDETKWIKANPNIGVTTTKEYIKREVINAKNNSSADVNVKTKLLNIWCSSYENWISNKLILDSTKNVDLEQYRGQPCYVGVDLSAVSDLTAVSVLIYDSTMDKYIFTTKYYLHYTALAEHEQKELYKKWHFEKQIILTSGNAVDYDYILADILKINKICPIYAVFYDTYNATQFAINATEQGLNMQPFSQSLANFNRPTKEFERLLRSGKVIIDNNEITRFCFSNVVLKYDHNDNVKPTKMSNKNKIDGVISMLTALGGYLQIPKYDTSIYTF